MNKQDRDILRAEASMRILASMHTTYIRVSMPRDASDEQVKAREREQNMRRMNDALAAVQAANALIAELELHEEAIPGAAPTVDELVAEGIAAGGHILYCRHGRASFEDCPQCDAAAVPPPTGAVD